MPCCGSCPAGVCPGALVVLASVLLGLLACFLSLSSCRNVGSSFWVPVLPRWDQDVLSGLWFVEATWGLVVGLHQISCF